MCKLHVVCKATDNMPTTNCKHYRVSSALLPMHAFPSVKAERTSECLYGEMLRNIPASVERLATSTLPDTGRSNADELLDASDSNWLEVTLDRDGYSGFVQSHQLDLIHDYDDQKPTHRVCNSSTLIFDEPCIKSRVIQRQQRALPSRETRVIRKTPFQAQLTLSCDKVRMWCTGRVTPGFWWTEIICFMPLPIH